MVQLTGLVTLLVFLLSVGQVRPTCLRKETEIMKEKHISTANLNLLATTWFNRSAFYRFGAIGNLLHNDKAMIKLKLHCEHGWVSLYDKTRLFGLKLVACVRCVRFVCHLFLLETYHRLVLSQLFLWQRAKMQASAAGGAVEWSNCAVCVLLALLFVASPSRKCLKMSN